MTNPFNFATTLPVPCLNAHVYGLHHHKEEYLAELQNQLLSGNTTKNLPTAQMARIFAALHVTHHHKQLETFLKICNINDIAHALTLLDRPRLERQLQGKVRRIEQRCPHLTQTSQSGHDEKGSMALPDADNLVRKTKNRTRKSKVDIYRSKNRELQLELRVGDGGCKNTTCAHTHADSAVLETIQSASVSGALARMIRKWAKTLRPDFLEFIMLEMKNVSWRQVADVVHFHPEDFSVPYFLADVHGSSIAQDSFVYSVRQLYGVESRDVAMTFFEVAARFPQIYKAYASLRLQSNLQQSKEVVEALAEKMPLDSLIWYFEELALRSKTVKAILQNRLSGTDAMEELLRMHSKVSFFGKLVERILMFQRQKLDDIAILLLPAASQLLSNLIGRLQKICHQDGRIGVFGDASASMQIAVEAATILACMVSSCLVGELSFFSDTLIESPYKNPASVEETLAVCRTTRANRSTSLAAALWPYYEEEIALDAIVLVTDEGENSRCHRFFFAPLLKAYKEKLNPHVILIIVCVGRGERSFRDSLTRNGIQAETVTIDKVLPDLTKFDGLLEHIAGAAFSKKSEFTTVSADLDTVDVDSEFVVIE